MNTPKNWTGKEVPPEMLEFGKVMEEMFGSIPDLDTYAPSPISQPTPSKPRLTDPAFQYTTSSKTDVAKTFAKHGWTPPDRAKQYQVARQLNQFTW